MGIKIKNCTSILITVYKIEKLVQNVTNIVKTAINFSEYKISAMGREKWWIIVDVNSFGSKLLYYFLSFFRITQIKTFKVVLEEYKYYTLQLCTEQRPNTKKTQKKNNKEQIREGSKSCQRVAWEKQRNNSNNRRKRKSKQEFVLGPVPKAELGSYADGASKEGRHKN